MVSYFKKNSCSFGDDQATECTATESTDSIQPLHQSDHISTRVSFSECVKIDFILPREDFTQQEHQDSWYTREELSSIRDSVRYAVATLNNFPDAPETDDFTPRGIEARTRGGKQSKNQNKINSRAAVLFEQVMQQEEFGCINDAEQIAEWYYEYSEPCHAAAQMMGLRDEEAARAIYYASPKLDKFSAPLDCVEIVRNDASTSVLVTCGAA